MYLLSSKKISLSMAICRKCLEHSVVFPVDLVLKQLASHVSAEILAYEVFSHPSWELKHFFGRFKSVNERQSIASH